MNRHRRKQIKMTLSAEAEAKAETVTKAQLRHAKKQYKALRAGRPFGSSRDTVARRDWPAKLRRL